MADLIPLAVASGLWPLLIAVAVICLRAPDPKKLMGSFLAASLLTTVSIGIALVSVLQGTSLTAKSNDWFGPGLELTVGCLALLAGVVLWRRAGRVIPKPPVEDVEPGRIERMLARGAALAFVAGVVINIVPGVVPLVALGRIAKLDESFAETFALVLGFYVIMFFLVEIPLIGYVIAPKATADATARFNAWLDRNGPRLAAAALCVIGIYLAIRGLVDALD